MEHIAVVLKYSYTITNPYQFWLRDNREVIFPQIRIKSIHICMMEKAPFRGLFVLSNIEIKIA